MKSKPPQDWRDYVRIAVDLPMNPKLAVLDDPAAGWAHVTAICYCGANFTDGHFPVVTVVRLAGVDLSKVDRLVGARLWHLPNHDCPTCPQPVHGHGVVHDFLEHQRSAEEVKQLRDKRSKAGARGAETRWGKGSDQGEKASAIASAMPNAMASEMANGWQVDGKSMAEVEGEREEEKNKDKKASPSLPRKRGTRIPDGFTVTPEMVDWARVKTPHVDGRRETEKFINYWTAKSGKDATKVDWVATWRNWMLTAAERTPRTPGGFQSQTDANILAFLGKTGTDNVLQLPRGES
jgi:hypothetical protein